MTLSHVKASKHIGLWLLVGLICLLKGLVWLLIVLIAEIHSSKNVIFGILLLLLRLLLRLLLPSHTHTTKHVVRLGLWLGLMLSSHVQTSEHIYAVSLLLAENWLLISSG